MAETLAELRGLPDEELIQRHDKQAGNAEPNVNYYLAELARRDLDRQTATMVRYTWWIAVMTCMVTVATLVQLGVALTR
jgi:hypothetical protein